MKTTLDSDRPQGGYTRYGEENQGNRTERLTASDYIIAFPCADRDLAGFGQKCREQVPYASLVLWQIEEIIALNDQFAKVWVVVGSN
jgi:hypothetical protein